MDKSANVTVTLPKGDLDTIETIGSIPIERYPGVSELLINGEPGRLLIDLSQFENSEAGIRRMYLGVAEGFLKYHREKINGS